MCRPFVRPGVVPSVGPSVLGLIVILFLAGGCSIRPIDWKNHSAPAGTGFIAKTITHNDEQRKYAVFIPHDYAKRDDHPVILFLHGLFEGGTDGKRCVNVGLGPIINDRPESFPFIAIFPQSDGHWNTPDDELLALAVLDQTLREYRKADRQRVILSGLSNGGDGVWHIGAKYPYRFAALVPLCGDPKEQDITPLKQLPIWVFHNWGDPFKPAGRARDMVKRLEDAGANVRYTQYNSVGHDCWTRAFHDGELMAWMTQQRKSFRVPSNTAFAGEPVGND